MTSRTVLNEFVARPDSPRGVREEAGFFGSPDHSMFGVFHVPEKVLGALLICPPLFVESLKNYRREVLLARRLAARGIAVLRFHYRGTGYSDGSQAEITAASVAADISEAADELSARTGSANLSVLGTRLGGVAAATAARGREVASLSLWQPPASTDGYFKEIFRMQLMSELSTGPRAGELAGSPLSQLQAEGSVVVLGDVIHRVVYDSWTGKSLERELAGSACPVQLVQISHSERIDPAYERLIANLRGSGQAVDLEIVSEDETWWFANKPWGPLDHRDSTVRLLSVTEGWIAAQLEAAS